MKHISIDVFNSRYRPDNVSVEQLADQFRLLFQANGLAGSNESEYIKLRNILLLNNLEAFQLIEDLSPSCSSLLKRCMWKATLWRCDELFRTVRSSEGLCCAFNYFGIASNAVNKYVEIMKTI